MPGFLKKKYEEYKEKRKYEKAAEAQINKRAQATYYEAKEKEAKLAAQKRAREDVRQHSHGGGFSALKALDQFTRPTGKKSKGIPDIFGSSNKKNKQIKLF